MRDINKRIHVLGAQFVSTCSRRRWRQKSACTGSVATASSQRCVLETKNVQHAARSLCPNDRFDRIRTLTAWFRWVNFDATSWIFIDTIRVSVENLSESRRIREAPGESPSQVQQEPLATSSRQLHHRRHQASVPESSTASAQRSRRGWKLSERHWRSWCFIESRGINTSVL